MPSPPSRWYDTNSYFVGVDHNELVIYQGRIGGFLWYNPVEVKRTGVTTADVPCHLPAVPSTPGWRSPRWPTPVTYVSNLGRAKQNQQNLVVRRLATTPADHGSPVPTTTTKGP